MLKHSLKLASIAVMVMVSLPSYALEDEQSIDVRGGKLEIREIDTGKHAILYRKKEIYSAEGYSLNFVKKHRLKDRDVVLVMVNSGGTACPAEYFLLSVKNDGKVISSPIFGTCSGLAESTQEGEKIIIKMPDTGARQAIYTYHNGKLTKTEREMDEDELYVSDTNEEGGEIVINGAGKVLISGNPDRKVLKCVLKLVDEEKSFEEGWQDRIMSQCESR